MYEAELVQIYDEVFKRLNLPVVIRINHRKILKAISEVVGEPGRFNEITVAIDKWDKIGEEGVIKELIERNIRQQVAQSVIDILKAADNLENLEARISSSEAGKEGIADIREVFSLLSKTKQENKVVFDAKLARGLGYYTGCIFEVEVDTPEIGSGSIGGGGRYDNLTGVFGMPDIPGVGVSFGAERIYDALEQGELFPEHLKAAPSVLILPMDEDVFSDAFEHLTTLRKAGIAADMYPEAAKMQKQMKYANALGVPYVLIFGQDERKTGKLALKNMTTGEQDALQINEVVQILRKA